MAARADPVKCPRATVVSMARKKADLLVNVPAKLAMAGSLTGALLDFIPRCDPEFKSPYHLAEFCALLDKAPRGSLRVLCSVPIRHHKTWTVICAIVKWLTDDPTLNVCYMSYDKLRVQDVLKDARDLARNMGIKEVSGHNTIMNWRTAEGGGLAGFSSDQSRLGADIDILIWDDPYSGPTQAEDPRERMIVSKHIDFYTNRLMPGGSCIGIMSRFDPLDAMGEREQRTQPKWMTVYNSAIITDPVTHEEHAFAPHVFTLDELRAKRAELAESDPAERTWWAQWQNIPRSVVTSNFHAPVRYEMFDLEGIQFFIGLDMSWSGGKHSDLTAMAVIARFGQRQYLVDVVQMRFDFEAVESKLRELKERYPGARIFSYMSGPEKALVAWAALRNLGIIPMHAGSPKFVRARGTIDRWNAGQLQVPSQEFFPSGMRVSAFLAITDRWTGNEKEQDDAIDALVSASDAGLVSAAGAPRAVGKRRFA